MHEQHRERLRDRILGHGLESLADHELLEFYLFYAIPRADTNGLAHELLRRFGSLNAVLEASVDELQEVPGVGLRTAMLLSVPLELLRRYALGRTGPVRRYDTVSKIAGYFCGLFAGLTRERLYAMLLNSDMSLIDCVLLSEGSVNGTPVNVRRLTEAALYKHAGAVVLAHNHPKGLAVPSQSDLEMTDLLRTALAQVQVTLVEHLVVVGDRFCPILQPRYENFRSAPGSERVNEAFYAHFYNVSSDVWRAPPLFDDAPAGSRGK